MRGLYVEWLSRKTGEEYRLLSESEWEYVARAGTRTPFHYGGTISTEQANYNGNYTNGSGRNGEYREKTVPVGSISAERHLGCTTCTGTYGSGWRTVGMRAIEGAPT